MALLFLLVAIIFAIWLVSWPFRKYSEYKRRREEKAKKRKEKRERKREKKNQKKAGVFSKKLKYPILVVSKKNVESKRVYNANKKYGQKEGKKEYKLYKSLCKYIDKNKLYHGKSKMYIGKERNINTISDAEYYARNSKVNEYYYPDISYIDEDDEIYIDIELDEPFYTDEGKKRACHYHVNGNRTDSERDREFELRGWSVVRLSETQVVEEPDRCAKYVKDCIEYIRYKRDIEKSLRIREYRGPNKCEVWSKRGATKMSR